MKITEQTIENNFAIVVFRFVSRVRRNPSSEWCDMVTLEAACSASEASQSVSRNMDITYLSSKQQSLLYKCTHMVYNRFSHDVAYMTQRSVFEVVTI